MTVLFENFSDISDLPVNGVVEIWRPDLSGDSDGPGMTYSGRVHVAVVAGVMTSPDLDPGHARVMVRLGEWGQPRDIIIPDSPTPVQLRPLFAQYEPAQPPAVVSEAWQAAQAAETARDEAVAAAATVVDVADDVAQIAADRAAAEAAATGAAQSATSASTAQAAAEAARDAASGSAGAASTSATTATTATTDAESARDAAIGAQDAAATARTDAETAATTATTKAAEAAQSALDAAESASGGVPTTRQVATGGGLAGGGDLTADRTLSIAIGGVNNDHVQDGGLAQTKLEGAGPFTDMVNARQVTAEKGQPGGYAALDGSGKVPAENLPTTMVGGDGTVTDVVTMTQAAFDALGPGRPSTTYYVIAG